MVAATAFSLGLILLRRLGLVLYRGEERLLAFVTGSACLTTVIVLLCAAHIAYKGVYLAIAGISIVGAVRAGKAQRPEALLADAPRLWRISFLVVFATFTAIYFVNALAPEMSPDGTAYHLAIVDHYNRAHGFERVPTNMYFNISQGMEMLFLMAFTFGKHSAAAMVHFLFLAVLPSLMVAYSRRIGMPKAGIAAAVFVFVSPVIGIDGLSAYVDVALAVVMFAIFYLVQLWDAERDHRLLVPAAMLGGFAFSVKYTGFVAALYALVFVAWKLRNKAERNVMVARMAAVMIVFAIAWPIKNWMWAQNPVAPFANRVFRNPWVHVSLEEAYSTSLRRYQLPDRWEIPIQITLRGDKLSGLFGPLFLLSPLALLALRWRQGRQILLAGAVFALPYATNIGTRFLIPAAPYVALAVAIALGQLQWLLWGVMLATALLSWPAVVQLYCAPAAWRIDSFPLQAALRIETEDSFLQRNWPGYAVDQLIEAKVPQGQSVFLFGANSEAYTTRRMLVGFLSAPNETLRDMMWTAAIVNFHPTVMINFQFPRQALHKLRVVEEMSLRESWSITEFRVLLDRQEAPRSPKWRLTAHPNPWEVQLAFDNSLVTRWRTWEDARPGDYVEIDFNGEQVLDGAEILCSTEYANKQIHLEGLDARDEWRPLGARAIEQRAIVDANSLRAAATAELKARGVQYVLVTDGEIAGSDIRNSPGAWNLELVGEAGGSSLYRIR